MTNEEAIKRLKEAKKILTIQRLATINDQLAFDIAISALSKQSASSEQVGKDIKFPTIHCCREYDSIQDESGRMGFGVYDPKEKNIYIAGDVPKEIFLKALFHEVFHWVQDVVGVKFDENDANTFSDILYDAVDMFDDHGPELFGQKTIVEPGEVFVGESVLKEAIHIDDQCGDDTEMVDQFRDSAKKTDSERVSLLKQEKSNSFSKEPSEDGGSEMSNSDEWWKNYIRSRMNRDDGTDTNVGSTNFKLGDNGYVALSEKVTATIYDDEHEEWTQETMTIADVLDSVCDDYTVIHSAQPEPVTDCHGLTGDLISRQKAINAFHYYFRDGFEEDKWWNSTHVLAAIEGLPSEQSKLKWETCFDCPLSHGCPKIKGCTNEQAIEYASQIPNDCPLSTQPEIIHCEDCRWYEKSHYCGANLPAPDGFCSWAERRNDG